MEIRIRLYVPDVIEILPMRPQSSLAGLMGGLHGIIPRLALVFRCWLELSRRNNLRLLCENLSHLMLVSGSGLRGFSICARCLYRLMIRQYPLQQLSPLNTPQSRRINHAPRLSQQQAQRQLPALHIQNLNHVVSESDYKHGLKNGKKRIDLYTKDSLGMDSLGRPAEALILRSHNKGRGSSLLAEDMEEYDPEEVRVSASEMLQRISAERGLVGPQSVAQNLDDIRSGWVSKLGKKDQPTEQEYKALFKTLHAGFTVKQLKEYYGPEVVGLTDDPDNLDALYSSDLYARTSWTYGTTSFPRTALSRLAAMEKAIPAAVTAAEPLDEQQTDTMGTKQLSKSDVIHKIIRERWRLRGVDYEEALGEIDIRIRAEHVSVLENHSK